MAVLRDRLALALTARAASGGETPGIVVIEHGAALLSGVGKRPLWLLTQQPHEGFEVLEARIRGAGEAVRGESVQVAVLASEPVVESWLERIAPRVRPRVSALYLLGPDGGVRVLSGAALPALQGAWSRAMTGEGLPADAELDAAIRAKREAFAREMQEAQSLAQRLNAGPPVATYVIAALCIALFLLQLFWGDGEATSVAGRMGAGNGALLAEGEWWRLFAPAFLHASLMHIGMNMMALFALGPTMESLLGRTRFVALYLACGLGASLTTSLLEPSVSSVGASGAIWGLMGAMLGLALRPNGVLPDAVVGRLRKSMWTPIALNAAISFMPGIDMWGHFGGGAVGFVLLVSGVFTAGLREPRSSKALAQAFRALALVLGVVATASVAQAVLVGKPWGVNDPPTLERQALGDTGLEASVPVGMKPVTGSPHSVVHLLGGSLAVDPAVVQLIVEPTHLRAIEDVRTALDADATRQNVSTLAPASIVQVDGRDVASLTVAQESRRVDIAVALVEDWEVTASVVRSSRAGAGWEDLARRIAGSVRPAR